jgi:AraC-like DNA-binding protein
MRHRLVSPSLSGSALAPCLTRLVAVEEARAAGAHDHAGRLGSLVLALTASGTCESSCHGRSFTHRAGTLALIAPCPELRNRVPAGPPWVCRYLMLEGPWAAGIVVRLDEGVEVDPEPPRERTVGFTDAMDAALAGSADWPWRMAAELAALSLWLGLRRPLAGDLALAIGRLIDAAPDESWPLADIARRLGLGVHVLEHRFRRAHGCAPARWVRARRIAHAQRLMAAGHSDRAAAAAIGLEPASFSRVFLAVTGQRPTGWRRRISAW